MNAKYKLLVIMRNRHNDNRTTIEKIFNTQGEAIGKLEKLSDNMPHSCYLSNEKIIPIVTCSCGEEIECTSFTNTCDNCGADYNLFGQLLAPGNNGAARQASILLSVINLRGDDKMSKPLKNEWIRFRVTQVFKTAVERHIIGKYKNISDYIRKLIEQDLMNNTNSKNDNLQVLLRKAVERLKEGEP